MMPKIIKKNFVVKSNAIIEARYRLSLQESQVVLWLLTRIQAKDEDFKPHELNIAEFAKFVQVEVGNKYSELRKVTKKLLQRVMEIYEPETEDFLQISWLSSARYQQKKGCVVLQFDPELKPYLLQLKSHFTKIEIVDTLRLKSIYAVRVFELLLQYNSIGLRKMSISDLRVYCGINEKEYPLYADLKRKVIEKAKVEINNKTEYEIDYIEIKESRKVVAIEWTIKKKNLEKENQLLQVQSLNKELRSELALIESIVEYGYSKAMAKRIVKNYDENIVKNAIKAVDVQIAKNQVKNPKAMLRTAITEQWKPDIYKKRQKSI